MATGRGTSAIEQNAPAVEKVDYSGAAMQLNASITEQTVNEGYELEFDAERGSVRRRRKKYKKSYQLNQLDHGALIWKRWRKRVLIGFGLLAAIQGLLMATILGVVLGALGMASGTIALVKQFQGLLKPFTDQVQGILQFADQNGLPMEKVEEMLRKKVVTHLVSKQLFMYAMITLFGRGMGSTWLGVASLGIGIAALPGLYQSAVAIGSGIALLQQGLEMAMPQIRRYQHLFHPDYLEKNIQAGLDWYKDNSYYYQQLKIEERARQQADNEASLTAPLPLRTQPRLAPQPGLELPPINLSAERLHGLVSQVGKAAQQTLQQTPLDDALLAFAGAIYQR